MEGAAHTAELGCVYLIDLSRQYVQMALWSVKSLRRDNPDVPVVVLVADEPSDRNEDASFLLEKLHGAADEVRLVEPRHRGSGYFLDNRCHVASVGFDPVLYLDADTFVFGDIQELAKRFRTCDVVARPSEWAWRGTYRSSLAPDILCPMNSGAVLMTAAFADVWGRQASSRAASLMERPQRAELASWLLSVTPNAWSKEEWAFSELAWEGPWSIGLFADSDCHLLTRDPYVEDPMQWQQSTIFHTYSAYWASCARRIYAP